MRFLRFHKSRHRQLNVCFSFEQKFKEKECIIFYVIFLCILVFSIEIFLSVHTCHLVIQYLYVRNSTKYINRPIPSNSHTQCFGKERRQNEKSDHSQPSTNTFFIYCRLYGSVWKSTKSHLRIVRRISLLTFSPSISNTIQNDFNDCQHAELVKKLDFFH